MLGVFLSYAREDRHLVDPYFDALTEMEDVEPWMDSRSILPGQDWEYEISRAFERCDVVVIFMSFRSVTKVGYVQREAREALKKAEYVPEGHISLIPVLLEDCEVPRNIRNRFQYIDLRLPAAWEQVLSSLRLAAEQRTVAVTHGVRMGPFVAHSEHISQEFDGRYRIEIDYPRFDSLGMPKIAEDLSRICRNEAEHALQGFIEGAEGRFSEQQQNWEIARASSSLLSMRYSVWGYWEGAAHGNIGYRTKNFDLSGEAVREIATSPRF